MKRIKFTIKKNQDPDLFFLYCHSPKKLRITVEDCLTAYTNNVPYKIEVLFDKEEYIAKCNLRDVSSSVSVNLSITNEKVEELLAGVLKGSTGAFIKQVIRRYLPAEYMQAYFVSTASVFPVSSAKHSVSTPVSMPKAEMEDKKEEKPQEDVKSVVHEQENQAQVQTDAPIQTEKGELSEIKPEEQEKMIQEDETEKEQEKPESRVENTESEQPQDSFYEREKEMDTEKMQEETGEMTNDQFADILSGLYKAGTI